MKISNETIQLLKNYATINSNILIREGSTLSTISSAGNIFATSKIAEEFPREVAIYDLNSLLALLTLTDDQEVEFGEKSLIITKDGGEFEYFYSEPNILLPKPEKWPQKTPNTENFFEFNLSTQEVQTIQKACGIVGAPTLSLIGKNGKVTLHVGDPKTPSSNSYKKAVGEYSEDFDARLSFDNLKIVPDNYVVGINKKKSFHFKSTTRQYQLWTAVDPSSTL